MKKWGIIGKALVITGILALFRLVIDHAELDIISLSRLVPAFIGGAIFTVAIIFTGTLLDFKESEKIPGDLAASLLTLFQDARLLRPVDSQLALRMEEDVRRLYGKIVANFRSNTYRNEEVRQIIADINEAIYELASMNAPPQYLARLRTELSSIDRTLERVRSIAGTSFVPAAYAVADLAVGGVILILFFVTLDPFYEGPVTFMFIVAPLIALLLLIRDMDNPFEYDRRSYADVDFTPLFDVGKYLGISSPP